MNKNLKAAIPYFLAAAVLAIAVLALGACPDAETRKPAVVGAVGPPIPGPGDAGTVLTSNGPTSAVSWQTVAGGGGAVLPDGGTGAIWYETADAAIGALPIGTSAQHLTVASTGLPAWSSPGMTVAMDCDLTAQGTATFATDTTYSLCGTTITKFNSANDSVAANVGATGLVFTPVNGTDYNGGTRSFIGIYVDLATLIPTYDPGMHVRASAYVSSQNFTANYDGAVIAIESGDTTMSYVMKYGYGTTSLGQQALFNYNAINTSGFMSESLTPGSTNNVMVLDVPNMGVPQFTSFHGGYSAGWPLGSALKQHRIYTGPAATEDYTLMSGKTYKVSLGAQRAGSGTSLVVKFSRIKIEYR